MAFLLRVLPTPVPCSVIRPSSGLLWRYASSSSSSDRSRQRVEVQLKESDLTESFVKGSGALLPLLQIQLHTSTNSLLRAGKGGQKINKVRNCVLLTHIPTGIQVQCQKTRSLDGNRRAARKLLLQKLDDQVNGNLSKRNEKIEKLRRRKARRSAKSKHKYGNVEESAMQEEEEEEEEEIEEDLEDGEELADIDLAEHRFKAKKSK